MTICFQNRKSKLNSRAIKAHGLLKLLQNHQKRNKEELRKFKGDARKTWSVMKEILQ